MGLIQHTRDNRSDERQAGLKVRCQMVLQGYGGAFNFAKRFNIPYSTVKGWRKIPYTVVPLIHRDKPALFTAIFCRPDLKWDKHGNLKSSFRAGQRKIVYS